MTQPHEEPDTATGPTTPAEAGLDDPTLAEDLLLLLFQPDAGLGADTGAIAGENTLFYVLAGAVLADLGLGEHVRTQSGRFGTTTVEVIAENPPVDHILRSAWEYVADKPRNVQTVLAAIGPPLREQVLDRVVERGDIRRSKRKALGLFETSFLADGGTGRRAALLADVRAVLTSEVPPTARVAALGALIYGSGTLPQFHQEIPWTAPVIARAEQLKNGNWGAGAAAEAVARTVTATIVSNVVVAAAVLPRN